MVTDTALRKRLGRDVSAGKRDAGVIERSLARLPLYESQDTVKLDASALSPAKLAAQIAGRVIPKDKRGDGGQK